MSAAAAAATGKHAAFIGIQGGNALDAPGALDVLDDRIVRITLVHLSKSSLGQTSSPLGGKEDTGLTDAGRAYVEALDAKKISRTSAARASSMRSRRTMRHCR